MMVLAFDIAINAKQQGNAGGELKWKERERGRVATKSFLEDAIIDRSLTRLRRLCVP